MATPNVSYTQHVEDIKTWMQNATQSALNDPGSRTWCVLGMTEELLAPNIDDYFARTDVNKQYSDEVAKNVLTNTPIAYLQLDSDSLHSLTKMYVNRHQGRLGYYRNDLEHKFVRNYTSLSHSLAKLQFLKKLSGSATS